MEKSCAFVEFLLYNHFVELIACIVIVSLLFYCVYVLKRKNRHHDDYRESYSSPRYYEPTSDGESFEILVENKLSKLEKAGAKVIRNCYLRWKNGTTAQIDNVLIFRSGLYVIECKDFSGWIFGSSYDEYWTQTLPYGWNGDSTRNSFYNPIKQNQNHINCLRQKLPDYKLIPIHSIIVFSNKCSLMKKDNESDAAIIKVENLYEAIWKIEQDKLPVGDTGLQFDITPRYRKANYTIYTFTLENTKQKKGNSVHDEDCFFQVKFALVSAMGFNPLPDSERINTDGLSILFFKMFC